MGYKCLCSMSSFLIPGKEGEEGKGWLPVEIGYRLYLMYLHAYMFPIDSSVQLSGVNIFQAYLTTREMRRHEITCLKAPS